MSGGRIYLEVEVTREQIIRMQRTARRLAFLLEDLSRLQGQIPQVWQAPAANEFTGRMQQWRRKLEPIHQDLLRLLDRGLREIEEWVAAAEQLAPVAAGAMATGLATERRHPRSEWEVIPSEGASPSTQDSKEARQVRDPASGLEGPYGESSEAKRSPQAGPADETSASTAANQGASGTSQGGATSASGTSPTGRPRSEPSPPTESQGGSGGEGGSYAVPQGDGSGMSADASQNTPFGQETAGSATPHANEAMGREVSAASAGGGGGHGGSAGGGGGGGGSTSGGGGGPLPSAAQPELGNAANWSGEGVAPTDPTAGGYSPIPMDLEAPTGGADMQATAPSNIGRAALLGAGLGIPAVLAAAYLGQRALRKQAEETALQEGYQIIPAIEDDANTDEDADETIVLWDNDETIADSLLGETPAPNMPSFVEETYHDRSQDPSESLTDKPSSI